jgi:uncharacterized protein
MFEFSGWLDLIDERFAWVAAAAVLAGLVRGFSGFGSAMIFVPVASVIYEPKIAVVLLFIFDGLITTPMLVPAFRRCVWREVLPLTAGATVAVPVGVRILLVAEPLLLRWLISAMVLAGVVLMAGGWRYRRVPSLAASAAVGGVSGLAGGIASLYGPPVILFWLGGPGDAGTVRANVFAFLGLAAVVSGVTYALNGMFTLPLLQIALLLTPLYGLATWIGTRLFAGASERQFRVLAFLLCGAVAVAALPLWQRL